MRAAAACALLMTVIAVVSRGQEPGFDVVSIKENRSGIGSGLRVLPGGRFEWTNSTLRGLIGTAVQRYGFDQRQVVGGPDWIDTARFDVVVLTGSGAPPVEPDGYPAQLFAMMRAMLADRFGLVTHEEVREGAVYRLVLSRRDREPGPGLKPVEAACAGAMRAISGGSRSAWRPGRGPDCSFGGPPGQLQGNAVTIDMLSRILGREARRPVINETGLAGSFDVDVKFSPEFGPPPPGAADPAERPVVNPDSPSIFTAIQEQLGLKLESSRGPIDVLVIDKAERPIEN